MKKCLLLLVAAVLLAVTTSQEAKSVELRFAHGWSTKHHIHQVIETWANEIEEATDGRVEITIYSGGVLAKANKLYDAVDTGIADMAWFLHGYTPGKFPMTSVVELPFMTDNAISASQALWDLYENYPGFKEEYEGVKMLCLWVTDVGQLMTADKPVRKLEDMANLKLRVGSASLSPTTKALGAAPNLMPIGDLYDALQKGVVDGTLLGTSAVNTFHLQDVIEYMTIGNIFVNTMGVGISDEAWAKISPQDQEIIMELSGMRQSRITGENFYHEAQAGYDAAEEGGVEFIELSDAEKEKWEDAVSGIYNEWVENMESKGISGQDLLDEAVRLIEKYEK
ncbi:MAG: TRAP transporter substrate-binding protein [Desulfobacteraceae bacterium]|nr:TRAP transporter substrate-binding protein [Desulfobacteraceae bacterium]